MHRTGYQRPWHRAARGLGSAGGPVYWLMRLTIGSYQDPVVGKDASPDRVQSMLEALDRMIAREDKVEDALPEWYPRALDKLKTLRDDTDPSSYSGMHQLLTALGWAGFKPERIVGTADKLVALWFGHRPCKLRVECCEDGAYVLSDLSVSPGVHTEFEDPQSVVIELGRLLPPVVSEEL